MKPGDGGDHALLSIDDFRNDFATLTQEIAKIDCRHYIRIVHKQAHMVDDKISNVSDRDPSQGGFIWSFIVEQPGVFVRLGKGNVGLDWSDEMRAEQVQKAKVKFKEDMSPGPQRNGET
jgi:hypothetical protein